MENRFAEINNLKEHIKQILSMYEDQGHEVQNLKDENNRILSQIEEKNKVIHDLENKIEVLKTAKTISVSDKDKEEVKKKINKIVREIDKSIGLLNE